MGELFSRLKKLANRRGEVIVMNEKGDDALVVMSLERYEDLVEDMDFCSEDCDCMDDDFDTPDIDFSSPPSVVDKIEEKDKEEDEKELMKRVNEDIAKWREEQEQKELGIKNQELGRKDEEVPVNVKIDEKEESVLTEEEKYYLEPLE
ncbi:hypothetical protein KJ885_05785 [Patescibacteria group bacterium]|nr:hypothetical protein [Patescibacteria group bacterium]